MYAPRSTAEMLKLIPGIYTESSGGEVGNRGEEAANAAIEMAAFMQTGNVRSNAGRRRRPGRALRRRPGGK